MGITGGNLAGGNPQNGRVALDYYVTNPRAVDMLLAAHSFDLRKTLEPCVGNGSIAERIKRAAAQRGGSALPA